MVLRILSEGLIVDKLKMSQIKSLCVVFLLRVQVVKIEVPLVYNCAFPHPE